MALYYKLHSQITYIHTVNFLYMLHSFTHFYMTVIHLAQGQSLYEGANVWILLWLPLKCFSINELQCCDPAVHLSKHLHLLVCVLHPTGCSVNTPKDERLTSQLFCHGCVQCSLLSMPSEFHCVILQVRESRRDNYCSDGGYLKLVDLN